MRKTIYSICAVAVVGMFLAACNDSIVTTAKDNQSQKALAAANSIQFTANAEIENIKKRLVLTSDPGIVGYILLLNYAGQPILYEGVKGKVTSSGKRLTPPDRCDYGSTSTACGYTNSTLRAAASDEGTYGSSDAYIYYWNTDGAYRQWNGGYFYSNNPIRLSVQPLVVTVVTETK